MLDRLRYVLWLRNGSTPTRGHWQHRLACRNLDTADWAQASRQTKAF